MGLYLAWGASLWNKPLKKVKETSEARAKQAFRAEALDYAKKLQKDPRKAFEDSYAHPKVINLLKKAELETKAFKNSLVKTDKYKNIDLIKIAFKIAREQKTRYVEIEQVFFSSYSKHLKNSKYTS